MGKAPYHEYIPFLISRVAAGASPCRNGVFHVCLLVRVVIGARFVRFCTASRRTAAFCTATRVATFLVATFLVTTVCGTAGLGMIAVSAALRRAASLFLRCGSRQLTKRNTCGQQTKCEERYTYEVHN